MIVQDASFSRKEVERELEGLLWSRDLGTKALRPFVVSILIPFFLLSENRGLCSSMELDILVEWVNSNGPNSISAANALCALLHRPEYSSAFSMLPFLQLTGFFKNGICAFSDGHLCAHHGPRRLLGKASRPECGGAHHGAQPHCAQGDQIQRQDRLRKRWRGLSRSCLSPAHCKIAAAIIDSRIGLGVYKDLPVAIKTFGDNHVDEKEFRKEMVVLSIVKGPYVVACYGGSTEPEDEFIVMELMECSLYDLIHDESFDMDDEMRMTFALQTANAMQFLHGCGLIHRDLKSLNILISKVISESYYLLLSSWLICCCRSSRRSCATLV